MPSAGFRATGDGGRGIGKPETPIASLIISFTCTGWVLNAGGWPGGEVEPVEGGEGGLVGGW